MSREGNAKIETFKDETTKLMALSHLPGDGRKTTMTLARRRYRKSAGRINHWIKREVKKKKRTLLPFRYYVKMTGIKDNHQLEGREH